MRFPACPVLSLVLTGPGWIGLQVLSRRLGEREAVPGGMEGVGQESSASQRPLFVKVVFASW